MIAQSLDKKKFDTLNKDSQYLISRSGFVVGFLSQDLISPFKNLTEELLVARNGIVSIKPQSQLAVPVW